MGFHHDLMSANIGVQAIFALALLGSALLVTYLATRSTDPVPLAAPPPAKGWRPLVGNLRFFTERKRFVLDSIALSRTGNFRFLAGRFNVVCVSGIEGRKAFFDQKALNLAAGNAALFNGHPPQPSGYNPARSGYKFEFTDWFLQNVVKFMHKDYLTRVLPVLLEDVGKKMQRLMPIEAEGTIDPFDDIYRTVYQLTMRTLGATEIAEDWQLGNATLRQFEIISSSTSDVRLLFPFLPTPGHLKRMYAGARLYKVVRDLVHERRKSNRQYFDALSHLLEQGADEIKVVKFIVGALFAGMLNTGISAAWILVYLSVNPEWYQKVQEEVDQVLQQYRKDASESPFEVFGRLTIDEWERSFPTIYLCLEDTIRFQIPTVAMRQNLGDEDLLIGKTGEVIPRDWLAVYLFDEAHMNPNIYTDPDKWDPARYLPPRNEHLKEPHCYNAWGSGRHPCLGKKFARLEVNIIIASFVSLFDFHATDVDGRRLWHQTEANRESGLIPKPKEPVRIRYRPRDAAARANTNSMQAL